MSPLRTTVPVMEWMLEVPLTVLLIGVILGVLLEAVVPREYRYPAQTGLAILTVLAAMGFTAYNWVGRDFKTATPGSIATDGPTYFLWLLLLPVDLGGVALFAERVIADGVSVFATSVATAPRSSLEWEAERQYREHTEIFPLTLFALSGMLLFAAANDLLTLFAAPETFSLLLYLLPGTVRRRCWLSQEATLKYFLLGALSSVFFLFGVTLPYGYVSTFSYAGAAQAIVTDEPPPVLLLTGLVTLAVELLFRAGMVPLHTWTPDVYTDTPTPVTGFMAIATETAVVATLLRVLYAALGGAHWDWQPIIATVAVATMVVGAAVGLVQQDIKRLLAYPSTARAGFILAGLVAAVGTAVKGGVSSAGSIFFYLLVYGFAIFGGFGIIMMVQRAGGEANGIATWWGLGWTSPFVAGAMTLFLLSFVGIPLTTGFVSKLMVFAAAWQGGYGWLVLVVVTTSLMAAFFYLKAVVAMWFKEFGHGQQGRVVGASGWIWIVVAMSTVATIILGLVPGSIFDLAAGTAQFIH